MSRACAKPPSASLLDLPLEIRNDIYRHSYGPYKILTYKRQPSFASELQLVPERNPYLDLQLTCKQLLEEINEFQRVTPIILNLTALTLWPSDNLNIPEALCSRVKELHVAFRSPSFDILARPSVNQISSLDEEPLTQRFQNLEKIEITAHGTRTPTKQNTMVCNLLMLLCLKIVRLHPKLTQLRRIDDGGGHGRPIRFEVLA